ncbi:MAG: imidazole glycerol phosphate synthase subunit HisH [Oscillospiraceae bacterium]|nr:imidazole glycerol phosphate synthase subunit HisH [Oscillospiraceae bacterium]
MTAVIDYGAGNLFSVKNALDALEIPGRITSDPGEISAADRLILPGVGAFPDIMAMLERKGLTELLRREAEKKPFLGICLGMQVLFEEGEEFAVTRGLGLLPGRVEKICALGLKIPHMGWNELVFQNECPLLSGVPEGSSVYFVHSFRAAPREEHLAAWTQYGEKIPALVFRGHIFGAQFHPEKSGAVGLRILKNFCELR